MSSLKQLASLDSKASSTSVGFQYAHEYILIKSQVISADCVKLEQVDL